MELDPGTAEALRVVEEIATEAVARGAAQVAVEYDDGVAGLLITLAPTNARACPVAVTADYPPKIDMFLGPEPTTVSYEFWQDDWPGNLLRLRELLEAVVAGRYEQTIKTRKRDSIEVTGRFELPERLETHEVATRASAAVKPNEAYTLHFEPY
jgi:hypothetical protein